MKWTRLFSERLQMSVLRINMAQWVLHVVGMDDTGAVVLRKRLVRSEWLAFMANVPPHEMSWH
jgi:hypothetical protein